jgi:hypothetical protein
MLFSTCIGWAITVKKYYFDDMRMVIGILASREGIAISSQQIKNAELYFKMGLFLVQVPETGIN